MMELRLKQLEKTKAYRDSLSSSKNSDIRPRKRVIIAPSMEGAKERGGNVTCPPTMTTCKAMVGEKQILGSGHLNGKLMIPKICN